MSFCKFSTETLASHYTQISNVFITEFLPYAPDACVKVYLYGLYKCTSPDAFTNTQENFSSTLNLSPQDVEAAFLYWQDQGLVEIINGQSMQVRFLPVTTGHHLGQKFSKSKYSDFNKKAQEILTGRMITQTEYAEYYSLMERFNIEPEAFVLIMDYCATAKGANVGYHYITTVARNWANEGFVTRDAILGKVKNHTDIAKDTTKILKICGLRRLPTPDEQDKFIKWTQSLGFSMQTIMYVADRIMQTRGSANFAKIDSRLQSYYEAKRISIDEISDFEEQKTTLVSAASTVVKNMGLWFNNLEPVVEKYITHWFDLGHTTSSLNTLSNFCFKNSTRSLEGLDELIQKLYKKGIVSDEAIYEYLTNMIKEDDEVKTVLSRLGVLRNVNSQDRAFFKTWKYTWDTPAELFDLAIEQSIGKTVPMQYMNKLLSTWHAKGIQTKEAALATAPSPSFSALQSSPKSTAPQKEGWERDYSKEELNALFDSLDDIEV